MKEKVYTMDDIARIVGVSKTTISRYLKGELKYMSKETAKKIEDTVKKLNYRPNKTAQSLKLKNTGIIGFSVSDIGNPFFSPAIKGIQKEARKSGYQLLIADSNNSVEIENKNLMAFIDNRVDGIIINSVGKNKKSIKSLIKNYNKPVVLFDRLYDELFCDIVTNNNFEAAMELLEKISEFGYEKIIFLSKPTKEISTRTDREKAVNIFSENNGIRLEKIILKEEKIISFRKKIREIVDISIENQEKICFFALNEEILEELILSFRHSGISITKNIGIISFSNEKLAELITPGITCADQEPYLMGIESFKTILNRINNSEGKFEHKKINCRIYIKNSTI